MCIINYSNIYFTPSECERGCGEDVDARTGYANVDQSRDEVELKGKGQLLEWSRLIHLISHLIGDNNLLRSNGDCQCCAVAQCRNEPQPIRCIACVRIVVEVVMKREHADLNVT
jgi:hypothetical protein